MASKLRSAHLRLTLEPLERRDLLTVDPTWGITSALLLASAQAAAEWDNVDPSGGQAGNAAQPMSAEAPSSPAANQPPSGTDKSVTTLEDSVYTFTVADFGFSDSNQTWVPSGAASPSTLTPAGVLVLYNTASAAGTEIAQYYAQARPGVRLVGITGIDPNNENITADDYLAILRPQVLAELNSSTDVIVTTKGLPLRITVTEPALPQFSTYTDSNGILRSVLSWRPYSSLESELARVDVVGNWQMMGDQSYTLPGHFSRNPYYSVDAAFDHSVYGTRLTARLDGYTVADVKASIDRALQAYIGPSNHPAGPYFFLVDNDPSKSYGTSMAMLHDNVLVPGGWPTVYDNTSAFLSTAPGPVIGYDSHGKHQASAPAGYLLNGLDVTLADGAVFESWESYNAYSFNPASPPMSGQGQVAQWLQIGGTAGVGHVEEPTATRSTVTNEDQMFQMLLAGYSFAEAAWSGNLQLSFVNTVVGDPLMTWKKLAAGQNSFEAVKITTLPAAGTLSLAGAAVAVGQFVSVTDIAAGQLKFTPAADANGANYASITFQVQDSGGSVGGGSNLDSSPNTITINVTPVDDPPPTSSNGTVGFWKFNESSGTVAADASANHFDASLQGGAIFGAGKTGNGLQLSGASQRAVVADVSALDVTEAITLSAWIAPQKKATQTVVKKGRTDSIDGYEISLSSAGKVFVRFNQDTSGDAFRVNSTSSYPTNGSTWMHVAATYDGTAIRLYINGQLQGSKTASFSIKTNNTALGIGAEDHGARGMKGRIDDVLVANRALSLAEIQTLYQGTFDPGGSGPGGGQNAAPSVNAGADASVQLPAQAVLNGSASDDGQPTPPALSTTWSVVSGPGGVNFANAQSPSTTATFAAAGTYVLRLTASDGALTASDEVTITVTPASAAGGIVGHWNFDEGTGSAAGDASGSGNDGTLQGGAQFGAGYSGSGLVLAGDNQRVVVPDATNLDITGAITMAAWIAPGAKATQTVIKKGRADTVDGYEISLSSTGKVFVRFNQDTSGDAYRVDSTASYPTNGSTWMHVAATYDGSTIRLYINGQLQGSKAATLAIKTNNLALGIGADDNGPRSMRGKIDDVLLADRALSAAEISSLYAGSFAAGALAMASPSIDVAFEELGAGDSAPASPSMGVLLASHWS